MLLRWDKSKGGNSFFPTIEEAIKNDIERLKRSLDAEVSNIIGEIISSNKTIERNQKLLEKLEEPISVKKKV